MLPPNTTNAYDIFSRAQATWSAQQYPRVVSYGITVTVNGPEQNGTLHYHEYWFAADNTVNVYPPVSDEQLRHPYKPPPGFNFEGLSIGPRYGSGVRDFIAVPVLAPNYSFGIASYVPRQDRTPAQTVAQIRAQYHDPSPQKVMQLQAKGGLKTIALVTSSANKYRIRLVGTERIDGRLDYHLALAPIADPMKYRLRDLWIQSQTYIVDRAVIGANFHDAATESVPWTVDFQQIEGATFIASETAEKPLSSYHGVLYRTYRVRFEDIAEDRPPPYAQLTIEPQGLDEP